jgi:hypothetical protein
MKKVLFLDIDGVCNSADLLRRLGRSIWNDTDPELVKHVKRIIAETKCDVVLSSTWRLYPESRATVKRDVCHFIDVTKDMQGGEKWGVVERGHEVKEWLDRHPEYKCYAILDDNSDFLPNQWLFQTTWEHGITEDIAQAVIDHLNACDRAYA